MERSLTERISSNTLDCAYLARAASGVATDTFMTSRPPPQAVYWILQSCLKEIMRAELIPATVNQVM